MIGHDNALAPRKNELKNLALFLGQSEIGIEIIFEMIIIIQVTRYGLAW